GSPESTLGRALMGTSLVQSPWRTGRVNRASSRQVRAPACLDLEATLARARAQLRPAHAPASDYSFHIGGLAPPRVLAPDDRGAAQHVDLLHALGSGNRLQVNRAQRRHHRPQLCVRQDVGAKYADFLRKIQLPPGFDPRPGWPMKTSSLPRSRAATTV